MDRQMKKGDTVEFRVWDSLFKKWIHAIGTVVRRFHGRLWTISAKDQTGLQGKFKTWVHEDNII
jgi:hypothetical protein